MNSEAEKIVAALGLAPLPREGGFFRQTWRSAAGSAIYFLITPGDFSALHRLRSDETWHFYAGDAVEHAMLNPPAGAVGVHRLGPGVLAGEVPQLAVPAGVWQGARLAPAGTHGWALLGCTVTPAWDDAAFELGERESLMRDFPSARALVAALTR